MVVYLNLNLLDEVLGQYLLLVWSVRWICIKTVQWTFDRYPKPRMIKISEELFLFNPLNLIKSLISNSIQTRLRPNTTNIFRAPFLLLFLPVLKLIYFREILCFAFTNPFISMQYEFMIYGLNKLNFWISESYLESTTTF